MAQHQLDLRHKHRKGIPPVAQSSSRNNNNTKKMMTNNATIAPSPQRSNTPKLDRKDQQQGGGGDTASVASTVKISNVATPSPLSKYSNNNNNNGSPSSSMMVQTIRTSKINSILLDDCDDNQRASGNNIGSLYKRTEGYQRDSLLLAPISSITGIDDSTMLYKENFLLMTLEGLSPNDYLRIIADLTFIHPKLQLLLAGDRNQPIANHHRLRSFWNDLSTDDYRQISNSFLHHMRYKVKRSQHPFNIETIRQLWNDCRRSTSAVENDLHTASRDLAIPSSIPRAISRPTSSSSSEEELRPPNHDDSQGVEITADTSTVNQMPPSRVTIASDTKPVSPVAHITPVASNFPQTTQGLTATTTAATTASSTSNGNDDGTSLLYSSSTISSTSRDQKQPEQQQDPILILLDIVDNASVNSSSTNGYDTSMTSSIGSSSNMSRSYRQYNNNNRFPPQQQRIPVNHNSTINATNSMSSISATTSISTSYSSTTASSSNVIDNYHNQQKQQQQQRHNSTNRHQHHQQQYDMDNDSTTSSNTGYISTMSNGRISISGSVASV